MAMESHPDFPMWSAILRWSLAQSDGTDSNKPPPAPMDPEKLQFLKDFVANYSVDYAKRLCEILKRLSEGAKDGTEPTESMLRLLTELEEVVESLDWARDLCKLGGVEVLLDVVDSATTAASVKALAFQSLATAAQNDEPTQSAIVNKVGLDRVVRACDAGLADAQRDDEWARTAFAALSAVVRGHPALEDELCASGDAARVIAAALARGVPRLAAKAAFFLKALLISDAAPAPRLDALRPALAAALALLSTSDQVPGDPASMQTRDSCTAALVHAAKHGKLDPAQLVQVHAIAADVSRKSKVDEDLHDQAAAWASLP